MKLGATAALVALFSLFLSMPVGESSHRYDRANAYCRLGSIYLAEGKPDDAISAYERASLVAPLYWAAYYGLGEAHERKGDLNAALANFQKASSFNPGNVDTFVRIGHILFNKRQYKKSIEQHLRVTELMPDWAEPHRWLANTYRAMGDEDQARIHLNKHLHLKSLNSAEE